MLNFNPIVLDFISSPSPFIDLQHVESRKERISEATWFLRIWWRIVDRFPTTIIKQKIIIFLISCQTIVSTQVTKQNNYTNSNSSRYTYHNWKENLESRLLEKEKYKL